MSLITEEILEYVLERLTNLDDEELTDIAQSYSERQPVLFSYIMSATGELSNEEAVNDLVFLFVVVLDCFYALNEAMEIIDEDEIMAMQEKQVETMERLEAMTNTEDQLELGLSYLASQVHLFDYLSEMCEATDEKDDEDESNFTIDDAGIAFGCLKVVVDLLTESVEEGE